MERGVREEEGRKRVSLSWEQRNGISYKKRVRRNSFHFKIRRIMTCLQGDRNNSVEEKLMKKK